MIFKLFSQRQREEKSSPEEADVYNYDFVPTKLRVQVQQILVDAIGHYYAPDFYALGNTPAHNNSGWESIVKLIRREFGVHRLIDANNPALEVLQYLSECEIGEFIDILEVCCRYIEALSDTPDYRLRSLSISTEPNDALLEINYRFRQACLGYQYQSGAMMRIDNEYIHHEIIKPSLAMLRHPEFAGANTEFLEAHRLYREGKFQQAIHECGKAFESTLKCVCRMKGWKYESGYRASELLKVVKREGLYPDYLDRSFDQLLATLSSGLPQLRNNEGAHGQGPEIKDVPRSLAEYALALCAAKICLVAGLAIGER